MAEEKEATAGSSSFSSLKDHVSVIFGAQAFQEHISCDSISFLNALKVKGSVHIDIYLRVNSYFVLKVYACSCQLSLPFSELL